MPMSRLVGIAWVASALAVASGCTTSNMAGSCPSAQPNGPCAPVATQCEYGTVRCVCALDVGGAGASWLCDGNSQPDLVSSPTEDLAHADLTGQPPADLGAADLAAGPDLANAPNDLSTATPDLTAPAIDLATGSDMTAVNDLAAPVDLAQPSDLGGAADMGGPSDMGGSCPAASNGEVDNTCATPQVASVAEGATSNLLNRYIFPSGDVDNYQITLTEGFHLCSPGTPQPYAAFLTVHQPAGATVELVANSNVATCTNNPADWTSYKGSLCVEWTGSCLVTDDQTIRVRVVGATGSAAVCDPYRLELTYCRVGSTCDNCIL
jgi:hypothetical protein